MYVDANTQLSGSMVGSSQVGQTITGATAVLSTNTFDAGAGLRDIAEGGDLGSLLATITTTFTGLTALEIQAVAADDAGLSSNLVVVGSSGPVPVASLTQGARFQVKLNPRMGSRGQRYLGARYVPTGTSTAGALQTWLGGDVQDGAKMFPINSPVL